MDSPSRNTVQAPRILPDHMVVSVSNPVKHLTTAETSLLDNQASDADDEADSIYTDSDGSSIAEPTTLNQNDHGLHQIMDKVTIGKRGRDGAVSRENERKGTPAWESDRDRLIALLPPPPPGPPFRAPVAVMYLTDENGQYVPKDDSPVKRQKTMAEPQLTSDEEYVKVSQPVVKEGVNDGLHETAKEDRDDKPGSPAVIIGNESSDSDDFTKVNPT